MARSTDTKRTAARAKTPARRSPTRRKTEAGAARPQPPEEQAPAAGHTGMAAGASAVAPAPEAAAEPTPLPTPEAVAGAPATAVSARDAEPAAGPAEHPAMQPERADQARTEAAPGAPAAGVVEAAGAPPVDVAPALEPVRAAVEVGAAAAALTPNRSLIEGTMEMHGQMVVFACRQTEFGLAASRAMLASRSLPEIVSLQSAFIGRSVENALAHTLGLTRLSAEILRQGLRSGGAR